MVLQGRNGTIYAGRPSPETTESKILADHKHRRKSAKDSKHKCASYSKGKETQMYISKPKYRFEKDKYVVHDVFQNANLDFKTQIRIFQNTNLDFKTQIRFVKENNHTQNANLDFKTQIRIFQNANLDFKTQIRFVEENSQH